MHFHERTLTSHIEKAIYRDMLVILTGPAGSGKSALLKELLPGEWSFIDLKDHEIKDQVIRDPDFFLAGIKTPAVLDSVEVYPEIAGAVLRSLKKNSRKREKFILSGILNPLTATGLKEYPEKTSFFKLFSLSMREISGQPEAVLPWEQGSHMSNPFLRDQFLWETLLKGGMPQLISLDEKYPSSWFGSYLDSVVKVQLKKLRAKILSEPVVQFMKLLAARTGQPVNLSELARQCGTTLHIASKWLDLLLKINQVITISPYPEGRGCPVVKTEKSYFTNTGLLCYLLDVKTPGEAMKSPFAGAIFETAVINEIIRCFYHKGINQRIYYWRKTTGTEVSIVVENKGSLEIAETALSSKDIKQETKMLRFMKRDLMDMISGAWIVNPEKSSLPAGEGIRSVPFSLF